MRRIGARRDDRISAARARRSCQSRNGGKKQQDRRQKRSPQPRSASARSGVAAASRPASVPMESAAARRGAPVRPAGRGRPSRLRGQAGLPREAVAQCSRAVAASSRICRTVRPTQLTYCAAGCTECALHPVQQVVAAAKPSQCAKIARSPAPAVVANSASIVSVAPSQSPRKTSQTGASGNAMP